MRKSLRDLRWFAIGAMAAGFVLGVLGLTGLGIGLVIAGLVALVLVAYMQGRYGV